MIDLTPEHNKIVDAAFRRFTKYGQEKTTMAEIARDLGYSRTFLYYYFPDKESIYKVALIRRANLYFDAVKKEMKKGGSGIKMLEMMIRTKVGCAKDYHSLGVYANATFFRMLIEDPDLQFIFADEQKLFTKIIQAGIKDGSVVKCNATKTAQILVDSLHGYMSIGLRKLGLKDKVSGKDFEAIYKRQIEYGLFLVNALKPVK